MKKDYKWALVSYHSLVRKESFSGKKTKKQNKTQINCNDGNYRWKKIQKHGNYKTSWVRKNTGYVTLDLTLLSYAGVVSEGGEWAPQFRFLSHPPSTLSLFSLFFHLAFHAMTSSPGLLFNSTPARPNSVYVGLEHTQAPSYALPQSIQGRYEPIHLLYMKIHPQACIQGRSTPAHPFHGEVYALRVNIGQFYSHTPSFQRHIHPTCPVSSDIQPWLKGSFSPTHPISSHPQLMDTHSSTAYGVSYTPSLCWYTTTHTVF